MLEFYWSLGRDIVALKAESQWGSGFFNQLSLDMKRMFPGESGFSVTNLKYMKRWYLFYFEQVINRHQLSDEFAVSNRHQPSDELEMPDKFALVPWKHHVALFSKCQSLDESIFYIYQTIANNWSLADLEHENVHSGKSDKGNYNSRGSKACITIHPDDAEAFFSHFTWTNDKKTTGSSKGRIFIKRDKDAKGKRK